MILIDIIECDGNSIWLRMGLLNAIFSINTKILTFASIQKWAQRASHREGEKEKLHVRFETRAQ